MSGLEYLGIIQMKVHRADEYRYDPESKKYAVDLYKGQTKYLSAIALRKDQSGVSYLFLILGYILRQQICILS